LGRQFFGHSNDALVPAKFGIEVDDLQFGHGKVVPNVFAHSELCLDNFRLVEGDLTLQFHNDFLNLVKVFLDGFSTIMRLLSLLSEQLESALLTLFDAEVTGLFVLLEIFALHLLFTAEVRALDHSELALEFVLGKMPPRNLLGTTIDLVRAIYLQLL